MSEKERKKERGSAKIICQPPGARRNARDDYSDITQELRKRT